MPQVILYKDGAYQLYSTVTDSPCYEKALTLDELTEALRIEGGKAAIDVLSSRLERAHKTGCSVHDYTLKECVAGNRAGKNEAEVPFDEFVAKYLTLMPNV